MPLNIIIIIIIIFIINITRNNYQYWFICFRDLSSNAIEHLPEGVFSTLERLEDL